MDVGASHIRFVLATEDGEIVSEAREHVRAEGGPPAVLSQIHAGIAKLSDKLRDSSLLCGIAIGVPGGVDPQSGKVLDANNLPGWREVDLGRALEEAFQVPVYLDNDANMAAIGEHWRGVARGVDNFVFIALGTGIGAGIFTDGRICRGRNGFAGELFRMNLEWPRWNEDFPDTGYLESQVSGVGLAALARQVLIPANGSPASLAEQRDVRYLFKALREGNAQATELVERSFVVLGVAVANVVSVVDPELVVFNGGLVEGAPDFLLQTVAKVVTRIHTKPPRIELSTLADKAQIWGALATLFHPAELAAIRVSANPVVT